MKTNTYKPNFLSVLLFAFVLTIVTVILIGSQITLTITICAFCMYLVAGFIIGLDIA